MGAVPPQTIYPFQSQSTPDILISVGMYVYFITYPLILIILPATILNFPINSFCPLHMVLVLTSDNFLSIFPPSIPLLFLFLTMTTLTQNRYVAPYLLCVQVAGFTLNINCHMFLRDINRIDTYSQRQMKFK